MSIWDKTESEYQLTLFSFLLKAPKKRKGQTSRSTADIAGTAPIINIQSPVHGQIKLSALMPGEGSYRYHWLKSGVVIQDATGNEYVVSDPDEEAMYAVVVVDASGSIVANIQRKLGRFDEEENQRKE